MFFGTKPTYEGIRPVMDGSWQMKNLKQELNTRLSCWRTKEYICNIFSYFDLLSRYDLEADNQILAEDKHKPMFQDMVDNLKVDYIPGGATQNTIRVASVSILISEAHQSITRLCSQLYTSLCHTVIVAGWI